ncbi:transporter substrate-binding domain-containing protein [Bdellovibrio sp. ArHS]|uniref:substrate-binding periplasmic protein n=1 Tax=Bdellovibrio sp. ArHS TaxID=1569284 RepID=UPI0025BF09C3|nr:transporter substrate-binding domain-containing protein [Bdellovibrio sp. ArHS]
MKNLFLITFCVTLCQLAQADTKVCERRYKVTVNNQAPSFVPDVQNGGRGLSFDLIKAIESRMGCTMTLNPVELPRAFEDLKNSRTDIFAFGTSDEEWSKYGRFIPLYKAARLMVVNNVVYDPKKSMQDYLKDPRVKFADQTGGRFFYLPEESESLEKQRRVIRSPRPEHLFDFLKEGRAQAMFSSAVFNKYFVETKNMQNKVSFIRDPKNKIAIGIYVSKRRVSPSEFQELQRIIKDLQLEGTFRNIVSRYVYPEDLSHYEDL